MKDPQGRSALTDPRDEPVFADVAAHGDAMADPEYRRLLGLPEPQASPPPPRQG